MENAPSESQQREIKRITVRILEKFDKEFYDGVLLCEGSENSIDIKLYSKVYLDLLVIPAGGCTESVLAAGDRGHSAEQEPVLG